MNKKIIYSALLVGFLAVASLSCESTKVCNSLIKNKPYLLSIPSNIVISEVKKFDNFYTYKIRNFSMQLPQEFQLIKKRPDSLLFIKQSNKGCNIFFTIRKADELSKNSVKYFDYFKKILYEIHDCNFLSLKSAIIPHLGEKIEIYEVLIEGNKGFLFKSKNGKQIIYWYDIFFDNNQVSLRIAGEENVCISQDEINYIISKMKTENKNK